MSDNTDEKSPQNTADLSKLSSIDAVSVSNTLKHRYLKMARKFLYTKITNEYIKFPEILVGINPYERLPIYGQDVIDEIHNKSKKNEPRRPHPYTIAANLFTQMMETKQDQTALILGNMGSGKTETVKLILRYLAMTSPINSMEDTLIEQQMIASAPILEAFGNAKTVLNNNSSRFSVCKKIFCDSKDGSVIGQLLETYLLEKSRVVFQNENERNFHIFYFMQHSNMNNYDKMEYFLSEPDKFHYSNQGKCSIVPGISDYYRFEELVESFKLMRMESEYKLVFKIASGILQLGNIMFDKNKNFGVVSNKSQSQLLLNCVCTLWGIKSKDLIERLETKSLIIMKKVVIENISFDEIIRNRDNIAMNVYEKLFKWLCQRINAELYTRNENDKKNLCCINVLDSFGFENYENNSLEQFCVNYMSEKLQSIYDERTIRNRNNKHFNDYFEMVENSKQGFFVLLDNASNAPKPDTKQFMRDLFKANLNSEMIKSKNVSFVIKHSSGDVTYNNKDFIRKNSNKIHRDTIKLLESSHNKVIKQLATIGISKNNTYKKDTKTITSVFYQNMKKLMLEISQTNVHFVICINPNRVQSNYRWDEKIVNKQLESYGIFDTVKWNVMNAFNEPFYVVSHWLRLYKKHKSFGFLDELIWIILKYLIKDVKLFRNKFNSVKNKS